MSALSDIQIARQATMRPVVEIAESQLGIPASSLIPYGHYKAKITTPFQNTKKQGKLILVTAITPTPAGEGKTTTSVGLCDALNFIGKQATVVLREPSLGPVFGIKGGAAGGGYAQVIPMEDINLHFTGDFAAISLAHNLISTVIDNHIHHGNPLGLDSRRIAWKRVVDMNDRALRQIVVGLGGVANGFVRSDGFDIVVASEIMAILCLADSLSDLKKRISQITIGYTSTQQPITVGDLQIAGAVTVLLKDALKPNIVQTLENNPAIIHGGPFANIAHGCNSVIATRLALGLSDYVVTEAGFGADLGAEKFIDIKCRKSGLQIHASVLVATLRAIKYHGGVSQSELNHENLDAIRTGFQNVQRHLRNIREHYRLPVVVALNHFTYDTKAELQLFQELCEAENARAVICRHWEKGGEGSKELAEVVSDLTENKGNLSLLYENEHSLFEKIEAIAAKIYGAGTVSYSNVALKNLEQWQEKYGHFPVCIAKTQYSFTNFVEYRGIPQDGHSFFISEARLNSGAEFIVLSGGNVMTMPGLPKRPAVLDIDIDENEVISGLF